MNALDRIIGYFDPARGAARLQARATMDQIDAFTGGPDGPYAAANKHQGHGRERRAVRAGLLRACLHALKEPLEPTDLFLRAHEVPSWRVARTSA